jgi:hypothetical protein
MGHTAPAADLCRRLADTAAKQTWKPGIPGWNRLKMDEPAEWAAACQIGLNSAGSDLAGCLALAEAAKLPEHTVSGETLLAAALALAGMPD